MAARSEVKVNAAIGDITAAAPTSTGSLRFMQLDLDDLRTIKPSVDYFLAREKKLDVLFNNAGVMSVAELTRTKQGHGDQYGRQLPRHLLAYSSY